MSPLVRALCATALVLTGCKTAPAPLPESSAPASEERAPLEFTAFEVTEQSLLQVKADVSGVTGPQNGSRSLSWTATHDGARIGEGEVEISPDAEGSFRFPITFSFGKSLEELAPYQNEGSVEVVVSLKLGGHEASRSRWVRSPLLPKVEIVSVQASRNTPGQIALAYLVQVKNPNPFEIRVSSLSYTAGLGGKVVAEGELPLGSKLPASAESMFELPAGLTSENAGADLNKILKSSSQEWTFTGSLDARGISVPFELSGVLPLSKE